jgi:hypothetical protein
MLEYQIYVHVVLSHLERDKFKQMFLKGYFMKDYLVQTKSSH